MKEKQTLLLTRNMSVNCVNAYCSTFFSCCVITCSRTTHHMYVVEMQAPGSINAFLLSLSITVTFSKTIKKLKIGKVQGLVDLLAYL